MSWDSSDGNPVNLIFLIVSGDNDPDQHVHAAGGDCAHAAGPRAHAADPHRAHAGGDLAPARHARATGKRTGKPASSAKVRLSRLLFAHALSVAEEVKARALLLHGDAVGNLRFIEDIPSQRRADPRHLHQDRVRPGPCRGLPRAPGPVSHAGQVGPGRACAAVRGVPRPSGPGGHWW